MERGQIKPLGGLRGVAAMSVVAAHLALHGYIPPVPFFGGGAIGVLLFFALSGFLMTHLYLPMDATPSTVGAFVRHRFARVYPLYALVILLSGVMTVTGVGILYPLTSEQVVRHLLLIEGDRVFWTISVEFQFYALFAVFWIALRGFRRAPDLVVILILLALYSALWASGAPGERLSIIRNGQGFIVGMLAALGVRNVGGAQAARLVLPASLVALLVACGLTFILWKDNPEPVFRAVWLHIIVGLCVWSAAKATGGFSVAGLSSRPMQLLGDWSYGIYLLHIPIIWMGNGFAMASGIDRIWLAPLIVTAVLVLARRSYLSFEMPMRLLINGRRAQVATA